MRIGLTLIATAASLLVAGVVAAGPAYASSNSLIVEGGTGQQYIVSCESSSGCNSVAAGTLQITFLTSDVVSSPLGVDYKIINGTAVDGTDFNTPATGEVTIATKTRAIRKSCIGGTFLKVYAVYSRRATRE